MTTNETPERHKTTSCLAMDLATKHLLHGYLQPGNSCYYYKCCGAEYSTPKQIYEIEAQHDVCGWKDIKASRVLNSSKLHDDDDKIELWFEVEVTWQRRVYGDVLYSVENMELIVTVEMVSVSELSITNIHHI